MPAGRPSKYDPAMCEKIKAKLSDGFSLGASCSVIGISRETCYTYMERHPEFLDAIKSGRDAGMQKWEQRLVDQAEEAGGNTAAIIFAMKNLYRDDWKDRQTVEGDGPGGAINITITKDEDRL